MTLPPKMISCGTPDSATLLPKSTPISHTLNNLKGFKLAHLNIASIPKHFDQLKVLMLNRPVDIFSINKTRLYNTIPNEEINIPGYEIFRKDRSRTGGGVALYIRNVFNIIDRSNDVPSNLEAICVEITKPKAKPFLVTTVYRPPSSGSEFMECLESYLQTLDSEDKELIITGDLNCDLSLKKLQSHSSRLVEIFNLFQLEQVITGPTRITCTHESLIDIIATNKPEKLLDSGILHLGISDHSLVYGCFKLAVPKQDPKFVESRTFKNYNQDLFKHDLYVMLNKLNWNLIDPNILWEDFKVIFNLVSESHAPIRSRRVRSEYTPWINQTIIQEMNHRDYLKKKAVNSKSESTHKLYKLQRNRVNRLIRNSKRKFCIDSIDLNKENPKEMWKHINLIIGRGGRCSKTTKISSLKTEDSSVKITKDKDIAESLNQYFTEIGPSLSNDLDNTNTQFSDYISPVEQNFHFSTISCEIVYKTLMDIKTSKASGPDNISVKLLKDSADVILPFLTKIFNLSLSEGIFPNDWKNARVSPIFKSGDKEERGNYRPISILSVVSKLFEKLVYKQVYNFLDRNNVLTQFQSGFRKGHSTCTSLLNTTNNWLVNMDRGLINGVIFLDLKKAFDTVDHEILIKKLELYGFRENCLRWFISYLSNRTQVCKVGKTYSSKMYVKTGVPQGSNLGPLLFLLYINDLPKCLSDSVPAMFADDTNVTVSSSSMGDIQLKLNNELEKLHHWLLANKLSLNVKKTEYMLIGSQQRLSQVTSEPQVSIGTQNINRVTCSKTLGVLVDENINWKNHIDATCKKISKAIGLLRRTKNIISFETLKRLYHALVTPHFDYCSLVWDNCSNILKDRLQKLQNKAGRIITGDSYEMSATLTRAKLGWKDLQSRRDDQLSNLVQKIITGKSNLDNLSHLFPIINRDCHNLRSNNRMLSLPKPRTNALKKSFGYRGSVIWNALPEEEKIYRL